MDQRVYSLLNQLTLTDEERKFLISERDKNWNAMQKSLGLPTRAVQTPSAKTTKLIDFVRDNSGCDRQRISAIFPELTRNELTNLLTHARRHGHITNTGTRKDPRWIINA